MHKRRDERSAKRAREGPSAILLAFGRPKRPKAVAEQARNIPSAETCASQCADALNEKPPKSAPLIAEEEADSRQKKAKLDGAPSTPGGVNRDARLAPTYAQARARTHARTHAWTRAHAWTHVDSAPPIAVPDQLEVEHELSVEEGARWHGVAFESLALVCLIACIRVWVCVSMWIPASEL